MKKSLTKVLSLSLCAALALGGLGSAMQAPEPAVLRPATARPVSAAVPGEGKAEKDETVYVLADAGGAVRKVIVSDWLQNTQGSDILTDVSGLTGVENVKGGETWTQSGGQLVWDAQGNDIYYQGSSDKELPVEMKVSYTLDSRPVSPEELAGKSGRVAIRFDYTNRQVETVEIGGKREEICVPFAVLTGALLDNEVFRNVEVSSGRLCNDGDRTVVVGLAFPGLQENLAVDRETLDIPDYVEITADVEDFRLDGTLTMALSSPFAGLDTGKLEVTGDLGGAVEEMSSAMAQLMDGSSQLYDGLGTLLERSGALVDGVDALAEGTGTLRDGAAGLEAGAGALQDGAASLSGGLEALQANNAALNGAAGQVFDTLLASAGAQLAASGLELPELTAENYAQVLEGVIAAMPQGAEPVAALKASLDSYYTFYMGLQSYTAGVSDAAAGARQLESGARELRTGAAGLSGGTSRLYDGMRSLKDSAPTLVEGVAALHSGAGELSEGLKEFNEEGIQKLADAVDGDLQGLMDRIQASADAAQRFQSFSGISGDMDGSVKFIYRTDSIEKNS